MPCRVPEKNTRGFWPWCDLGGPPPPMAATGQGRLGERAWIPRAIVCRKCACRWQSALPGRLFLWAAVAYFKSWHFRPCRRALDVLTGPVRSPPWLRRCYLMLRNALSSATGGMRRPALSYMFQVIPSDVLCSHCLQLSAVYGCVGRCGCRLVIGEGAFPSWGGWARRESLRIACC